MIGTKTQADLKENTSSRTLQDGIRVTGNPFDVLETLRQSVPMPDRSKVRDGLGPVVLAGEGDITDLNNTLFLNNRSYKQSLKYRFQTSEELRANREAINKLHEEKGLPAFCWAWVNSWAWESDNWGNRWGVLYFSLIVDGEKVGYYSQRWGVRDENSFLSGLVRWGINQGGHMFPVFWNHARACYRLDNRKKPLVCR